MKKREANDENYVTLLFRGVKEKQYTLLCDYLIEEKSFTFCLNSLIY